MRKGNWKFDDNVAARFQTEARTHIPNYEAVVQKCVQIAQSAFPQRSKARIIDVGSALGYTIERLLASGFTDVHGVENAASMIKRCRVRDRIVHSATFPKKLAPFNMVMANWTLHFIPDRENYILDIYNSLSDGGIFILSDKMLSSIFIQRRYHDFKRSMGVSEDDIVRKEASLKGVLNPYPLEKYFQILSNTGFKNINVIDAEWCFATLIAFK